jgi:predicted kinase
MASVHLLFGPTGAGKTTYGRKLAAERRAALFVIDEWMQTLFMMDAPSPPTLDWMLPRVERAETQIWAVTRQLVTLGTDVILELGFFTRAQRDRIRAFAAAAAIEVVPHVLDVPRDARRERVRKRNQGSSTFSIDVDDATFEWAESYYEPLAADELRGATIIRD